MTGEGAATLLPKRVESHTWALGNACIVVGGEHAEQSLPPAGPVGCGECRSVRGSSCRALLAEGSSLGQALHPSPLPHLPRPPVV